MEDTRDISIDYSVLECSPEMCLKIQTTMTTTSNIPLSLTGK